MGRGARSGLGVATSIGWDGNPTIHAHIEGLVKKMLVAGLPLEMPALSIPGLLTKVEGPRIAFVRHSQGGSGNPA